VSAPLSDRPRSDRSAAGRMRALIWWYAPMALGGLGFGLFADRRPFGEGLLVHPLVMFFALVGLGLIALRVVLSRPVPSLISDRELVAGCVIGIVAFLCGNFLTAHIVKLF
jgi:predicted cobalt transporter CbtA